ncbi:hypothetical protein C8J56DRAFT_862735 [Mycena floridula]|nr:hypothetical protein C8J56DRAFT_862735 [Mycena floridula]
MHTKFWIALAFLLSVATMLGIPFLSAPSPLELKAVHMSVNDWQKSMNSIDLVAMTAFGSSRFGFDDVGNDDWKHILPASGHTLQLLDQHHNRSQVFTVTLFHQLKCLEIWRSEYLGLGPPPSLVHHCMNYLRQQILCHMNLRLESAKDNLGESGRQYDTVCRDWSKIFVEADRNSLAVSH